MPTPKKYTIRNGVLWDGTKLATIGTKFKKDGKVYIATPGGYEEYKGQNFTYNQNRDRLRQASNNALKREINRTKDVLAGRRVPTTLDTYGTIAAIAGAPVTRLAGVSAEAIGNGLQRVFSLANPSTYMGRGAFNTVLGGTNRTLRGALADAAYAAGTAAGSLNVARNTPNIRNLVNAGIDTFSNLPFTRTVKALSKPNQYYDDIKGLIPRYNAFAKYYGYKTVPQKATVKEAEDVIKRGLSQHNTFYRGVSMPNKEDVDAIKNVLGENATDRDIFNYLAKQGSRNPYDTYLSPDSRANFYADNGDVAIIRRKYHLGENPRTWLDDADFTFDTTPATSFAPRGTINYPWASSNIIDTATPGEIRLHPDDFTFEGWLPTEIWEGGKYVPESAFNGSRNRWFNTALNDIKPKFRRGGSVKRSLEENYN